MPTNWTPALGELIWIEFDPQQGHEQRGRRPALVLSPDSYNRLIGLVLVCPITSRLKGYPFEVPVSGHPRVSGVVLADQVRSFDWRARKAHPIGPAPAGLVDEVMERLETLLPGGTP